MPQIARPFRRDVRSTPTRALVVYCHPLPTSFVAAARDRVLAGLATTDADVRLFDLYAEGFVPEFSATERMAHLEPGTDPDIDEHAEALRWCDTLILVYPTWWAGQPAMLKGWFDRVWASEVAWSLPDGANRLQPRLRNVKRIVAITTHGSPKYINAVEGEGGKRTLTRALRAMCHPFCRVDWVALYGADRCNDATRAKFLDRVEARVMSLTR